MFKERKHMKTSQKVMGHVYAIFTILVWGSCFVLTKELLKGYTAIQIIPLRMGLAYVALWALRPRTLKLPWKDELMFILIGITGGTGAGKTSLLRALERKGACVLDCDAVYHEMLKDDEPLLRALREAFGDVIFRQDGSVDVHAIGLIVFKDRKKLAELDAIVHERIPRALAQKMAATNAEIIGLDAIKLIESGLGAICDATVAVTAPEEVRIKRIMARDSITEEYARSRIAAQKDADYFRAQCDYEFVNDLPTAEKAEHAAEVYINTIINNLKEETER